MLGTSGNRQAVLSRFIEDLGNGDEQFLRELLGSRPRPPLEAGQALGCGLRLRLRAAEKSLGPRTAALLLSPSTVNCCQEVRPVSQVTHGCSLSSPRSCG
jgi:hypothetical protein